MSQETEGEKQTPFEALEKAGEHKATAEDHELRSQELVEEAEAEIEERVESEFPIDVSVSASTQGDFSNVDLRIRVTEAEKIVSEALNGIDTAQFQAQHVVVGENPSYPVSSNSHRDRIQSIKGIINDLESEYDEGAPVLAVIDRAEEVGVEKSKAENEIEELKQKGEVYEPRTDHLRTT